MRGYYGEEFGVGLVAWESRFDEFSGDAEGMVGLEVETFGDGA